MLPRHSNPHTICQPGLSWNMPAPCGEQLKDARDVLLLANVGV